MAAKEKSICSTMKISIRCHPALIDLLPAPKLAKTVLPRWVRDMPSQVDSPVLGSAVRTLKHCPPILDAMGVGITFYLPTDIHVGEDGFTWDWNFPVLTDSVLSRAPIGFHLSEQTTGSPFESDGAPYRNNKLVEELLKVLHPETKLCIACDITLQNEYIETKTIADWAKNLPDLHKRPTIFLLD